MELTRNPAGLISALRKLEANDEPFAKFNHATAAMCIDDPLQHHETWFHRLFDTHPPIADRIAALETDTAGSVAVAGALRVGPQPCGAGGVGGAGGSAGAAGAVGSTPSAPANWTLGTARSVSSAMK